MSERLADVDLDAPVRGEVLRYEDEDCSSTNLTNGQHYLVVSWTRYEVWECHMLPIRPEDVEDDEKLAKALATTGAPNIVTVDGELTKDKQKFVVVRSVITTEELEEKFEKDKQAGGKVLFCLV